MFPPHRFLSHCRLGSILKQVFQGRRLSDFAKGSLTAAERPSCCSSQPSSMAATAVTAELSSESASVAPLLHSTISSGGNIGSSGSAFRHLKLLDLRTTESRKAKLPLGPLGLRYGELENGMKFYVKQNAKPKDRAAIALAVKIGSVVETEEERGVAHIVEHLAFSATKKYSNHDIVKFLESIGAEFGACQNAYTSADETVFELLVPIDKPGLLSQAISVLSEFSSEIRVAPEDLEKERGAVLEEWRERRNAMGRMQDAHWKLLMQGSQYAERQPIGLESVIRNVSASTVRNFYHRWYRPENMAIVAAGDFSDPDSVVS